MPGREWILRRQDRKKEVAAVQAGLMGACTRAAAVR